MCGVHMLSRSPALGQDNERRREERPRECRRRMRRSNKIKRKNVALNAPAVPGAGPPRGEGRAQEKVHLNNSQRADGVTVLVILAFKCFYSQPIRAARVKRELCAASRGEGAGKRICGTPRLRMGPKLTERPAEAARARRIQIRRLEFLGNLNSLKASSAVDARLPFSAIPATAQIGEIASLWSRERLNILRWFTSALPPPSLCVCPARDGFILCATCLRTQSHTQLLI